MSTTEEPPQCPVDLAPGESRLNPTIEKHEAALLLLLGFAGFSVCLAILYRYLRRKVFKDSKKLDTVFDAGGRISVSLTAVTVTSQILWPSDLLMTATLISKSGIGGALFFSVAIVIVILLFPMLSLKLKTRAPGAKTFPQIAYARFGKPAHIMFCIVALFVNLIITANLILSGKAAIEVLTKDVSTEFVMCVVATLFGSYCLLGGLGTTFYMSYFNTAVTFISASIFVLQTNYLATDETKVVASRDALFEAMSCIQGPEGNYENSLLSFRSRSAIIFGVVLIFMAMSSNICDQANWQSRVAAKPAQGVTGFIAAGFIWFSLPTSLSFATAMTYMSMSYRNGTHQLESGNINAGYIMPFAMNSVLGSGGAFLMMTVLMMSLMSTGSGEVMSISSIIVYDIYKTYVSPFRKCLKPTDCPLCGKDKVRRECSCPSSLNCSACLRDTTQQTKHPGVINYTCSVHGNYRQYEAHLLRYKSWCMLWVIILVVPFGLVLTESKINLLWGVLAGTTLGSPFLFPIILTLGWSRTTGKGAVAGGITGLIACISGMLIAGSRYEGGITTSDNFFSNTAKEYSLLSALGGGVVFSTTVCVITSLCTTKVKTHEDEADEWAKTMSIDNPLNPYRAVYAEELDAINAGPVVTSETMSRIFRRTKRWGYAAGGLSLCLFLIVIPAVALSYGTLKFNEFNNWLSVCQIWCFVATVLVVLLPPIEESIQIYRQYKKVKKMGLYKTASDGNMHGNMHDGVQKSRLNDYPNPNTYL